MAMHHEQEHTGSYYAASRRVQTDYPRLRGDVSVDVAIVGAGFTGVSTALKLAEGGYSVALIEANRIGWGASGRNGGQLIDGMLSVKKIERRFGPEAAKTAYQMGVECRDIVVNNIRKYSIDCDLKFGYAELAMNQGDIDYFHDEMAQMAEMQYPHRVSIVEQQDMASVVGSERYISAMVNEANGHLQPLDLCIGEARAAESLGAQIFEQSPVSKIHHGDKPRVETADGVVNAAKVVLAGNAYLGDTEPKLRGKVIPAGSYIIATEPLDNALAAEVSPRDLAFCDLRVGLDYFRLSADKRMLFGGLCNYSGRVPSSISDVLQPKMLRAFPQLKDVRIDYEWGGNIAISVNRIPQFGRIQNNTYYAQGYSGHGLAPSHMAGHVLADAIAGDSERFDLFSKVWHWRLPGGKWFANPALALGMMYFRLKEIL